MGVAGDGGALEFSFEGRRVRTADVDGEPWLSAADLCVMLNHSNPSVAVRKLLDDDEWRTVDVSAGRSSLTGSSPESRLIMVSESGAWTLVLTSEVPGARRVRKWLAREVLPSIRRTGGYAAPGVDAVRAAAATERAEIAERDRQRLADLVAGVSELLRRGQWRENEARGIEIVAGNEQRRLTSSERRTVESLRRDAALDAFAAANSLGFAREQWSAWCSPSGVAAVQAQLPEHGDQTRPPSSATTLLPLGDGDGSTPGELGS